MGEVYRARYRYDGEWQVVDEPALLGAAEAASIDGRPAVCGNGLLAYPEAFAPLGVFPCFPEILPHARAIAALAVSRLAQGDWVAARGAQPLYLRNKVALTTLERMAVAAGKASGATV